MATGYRPRRFDDSPLFRIVRAHFDDFRESYHRNFSDRFGRFRDIVTHTVNRFLLCGDPREGIARFECPQCNESVAVPFSCKTRLFCPTCHEIKTVVWIDAIQGALLLPVAHRFWTFSIPKRLRYYFMRNRKLLGLMVAAAANTLAKSLADGKLRANFRPGIVARIFGEMPLACPKCGTMMELAEFVVDEIPIAKPFPDVARAPPGKQFDRYEAPADEPAYGHVDDENAGGAEFNQIPKDVDAVFNQENSW